MRRAVLAGRNAQADFDRFVTHPTHAANRIVLRRAKNRVLGAYGDYAAYSPNLQGFASVCGTPREEDALRECYTKKTKPIRDIRTEILSIQTEDYCPYCG